jgi:hypothetical protein
LDARIARSPSRRAPGLKALDLGEADATIPSHGLTTLTLRLSDQGSLLLRRYRRLLIRIHLKIVRSDAQGFIAEGAYLTRLRAP